MHEDPTHRVIVTFPGGRTAEFAYGTRIHELIQEPEFEVDRFRIVGGRVNNEVVSLAFKVEVNSEFRPVTIDTPDGARIYRQSLCFLLP